MLYLTLSFIALNLGNFSPNDSLPAIRWGESRLIHNAKSINVPTTQSPDLMELSTLFDNNLTIDILPSSQDTLIRETFKIKQALYVKRRKFTWTNDLRFFVSLDSTSRIAVTLGISDNDKFTIYYDGFQDNGNKVVRLVSHELVKKNLEYTIEIEIHRRLNSSQCLVQFDSSDIGLLISK